MSLQKLQRTKYNLFFDVETRSQDTPQDVYDASVKVLAENHLLGRKHVTFLGRILDEFDVHCPVHRIGTMDIFYRGGMDRTARELHGESAINASSEDEVMGKALEVGSEALDILEEHDPSIGVIPYGAYMNIPFIASYELSTPSGRQSVHLHGADGRITRLFRPAKDRYWYDHDTLKTTLLGYELLATNIALRMDAATGRRARCLKARLREIQPLLDIALPVFLDPDSVESLDSLLG